MQKTFWFILWQSGQYFLRHFLWHWMKKKMSSAELIIGTFVLISGQTITIEDNNVLYDNFTTRNEFSFMRIFILETDEPSKQALNIHVAIAFQ